MGNVVERVVVELLSEEAEQSWLLRNGQFRSWKGRSAIYTVAIIVDRAHTARAEGHITGVLLMHIKEAFPRVALEKPSQLDQGQTNGWGPYTMDRELSLRHTC